MRIVAIKIFTAIAGGALAFFLNYLVASKIGETPFYPGGIIYLAVAARMGLPFGIISAGIAAFSLPTGWIQCLPLLETAGLYGLIFHHRMSYSRAGLLFWLFAGAPYVAFTHLGLFKINPSAFIFSIGTFIAGGFLNLTLAKILADILNHNITTRPTLRLRLYELLVLFTAVPVIFFALYSKNHITKSRIERTHLELTYHCGIIAKELEDYLSYNHRSITSMAASIKLNTIENRNSSEAFLNQQHQLFPAFQTMLIADANGLVIAGSPPLHDTGEQVSNLHLDISDRMYFTEAMHSGLPYLSGVFLGGRSKASPVVAMSAPVLSENDQKVGIVEGSLDLSQLKFFGGHNTHQTRATLVILDQDFKVAYAPTTSGFSLLQDVHHDPLFLDAMQKNGLRQVYKPNATWEEYTLAHGIQLSKSGWYVLVKYDLHEELILLNGQSLLFALITLILIALASFIAEKYSQKLTEPLRALIAKSRIINTGHPASLEPVRVAGSPREVIQLVDHFETMAQRLETAHSQLLDALSERDQLNADLKAHNLTLDRRVKERTTELEKAKVAAEKADVAKSAFLANMSHEIRTPMNALIGLTEVLAGAALSQQQREYVTLIQDSSRSLLEIINSILDYSKIEVGKMKLEESVIAIDPLIQSLVGLFNFSAKEKGLKLILEMDPKLPEAILGDKVRFRQILSNLLSNAIKFTSQGSVTLKGIMHKRVDGNAEMTFQVMDHGIGIPANELEDIFKAFEQSSRSLSKVVGGTGLGLAISRKLAQMMGGTLKVESEPQQGSIFSFTCAFPIQTLPTPKPERPSESRRVKPGKNPRLLVVEDHKINQKVCEAILRKLECNYSFANHGEEALQVLAKEDFDMVLMDCQMPVMDGYEATKRIRASGQSYAAIPIIALTANALSGDRDRCLEAGMDDFLSKPFHLQGLRMVITKWLGLARHRADPISNDSSDVVSS